MTRGRPARRPRHHLSVDNDRCRRYGMCAAAAPELFRLMPDGGLRYLRSVSAAQVESARAAVRDCPKLAIILEER